MNVQAEHLRKQFTTVTAVDDISLNVVPGKIFGLIGPNGAGKSTTIRMLLNIMKPDSGTILYNGKPFSKETRNSIGYLPEERGLYRKNGVLDTIIYFAELRGIETHEAKKKGMQWLERFNLTAYAKRKIEELSKGNQQKVQFITSILHNPDIIVLDEPFSGLDPVNQIVMKDILQELKQKEKTVIFSTHQMESAEKLCDEICMINHGKIVLEGTIKNVKQKFGSNSLHIEYDGDASFVQMLPFIKKATVYENYAEVVLKEQTETKEVIHALTAKLDLRKFEFVEPSLNSIFLDIVGISENNNGKTETINIQQTRATVPLISQHPKVKKAFLSFVGALLLAITLLAIQIPKHKLDITAIGIMCVVLIISFVRFLKERKNAAKEVLSTQGGSNE